LTAPLLPREPAQFKSSASLAEKRSFANRVATRAAEYVGIPLADIWGHSRTATHSRARRLTWGLLVEGGLTVSEIARIWDYNHSSVLYAVNTMRSNPERMRDLHAFSRKVSIRLLARGSYSLEMELADTLASVPAPVRHSVGCYVFGDLLGCKEKAGSVADRYHGHRTLVRNPPLATDIRLVLLAHEETGAAAILLRRCQRSQGGVWR
jgi:hypothetical protein